VSGGNFVLERNDAGGSDAGSGGFAYALAATVTAQNNAIGGGSAANGGAAWSVFNSRLFETNDTVVDNYGGLIGTYANPASTLSVVNSICWNPLLGSDIEGADAISYCCLNDTNVSDAGKSNVVGGGVVFGDPGFANLVPHSPDLGEGSICLDAADTAQAPSDDIHGAARPQHGDGDGVADADIGCAEYFDEGLPEVTHSVAYLSHATRVTLTASDTASGPKQIRYRVDGGTEQSASGASAVVTLTDLGVRQLAYRVLDWADNSSAWTTVTVPVKYTGLSFAAPSVSAYRSARVWGYLKYANASGALVPFAGRTVRIQQYKGGAWTTVKYAVTSATGSYACTLTPTSRTWYRAVYVGSSATLLSQISASRAVLPQAYLTRPTGPVTAGKGVPFTAAGFLLPRHTAGTTPVRILCYRWEGGRWTYKGGYAASVTDYSAAYSKYSARVKLPSVGYWRIRAYYLTSGTNFRTYGPVRAIRVE
jgi:hypothetical protein